MKVETYLEYDIYMRGLNHFDCPRLKLYGYGSIRQLRTAIKRKVS
jgi:hypothetical protein